jgi:hypothetical protein
VEPKRAKLRTDIVLNPSASSPAAMLRMLIAEPKRTKDRSDNDEPRIAKSSSASDAPRRDKANMEIVLPRREKLLKDKEAPIRVTSRTE